MVKSKHNPGKLVKDEFSGFLLKDVWIREVLHQNTHDNLLNNSIWVHKKVFDKKFV